jgi:signal transduction histidine kinase/ActR/RegA family two-component response regulator
MSGRAQSSTDVAELVQWRAVFNALPVHLCLLDGEGRILKVNEAWRRFARDNGGGEQHVAEGTSYLGACGTAVGAEAQDAGCFADGLREVLAGRIERFDQEYPCHSPTELRWFVASAYRVEGPGPVRALVSHEQVTLRKLAEAREREAQRLEALGTLAGGIAHDFNNVLGSILGNAHLAAQAMPGDSTLPERLAQITRAALHARDLVRRILAFGRRQERAPVRRSLNDLVDEAFSLLAADTPPGVTMHLERAPEPMWVLVDAGEVQQVLVNLCTNAWRAVAARGGLVRVSLEPLELDASDAAALGPHVRPGQFVRCVVEDNGHGMDEATAARAFEPFFTTHGHDGGTGLGLAVVYGVAVALGGGVRLRTAPGSGSRFEVLLPLVAGPTLAAPSSFAGLDAVPQPAAAPDPEPDPGTARRLRVLLVDDDEVMGLTAQAMLEAAGHSVTFEPSASAALARLAAADSASEARFELLVSDHRMPEMSGIELCRAAMALRPGLPCVLVSGYLPEDTRRQAREVGVREIVAKEEAFERLAAAVQRAAAAAGLQDSRVTPGSSQA